MFALSDPCMLGVQIPFFKDDMLTIKQLLKYNGVLNQFEKIHFQTLGIGETSVNRPPLTPILFIFITSQLLTDQSDNSINFYLWKSGGDAMRIPLTFTFHLLNFTMLISFNLF